MRQQKFSVKAALFTAGALIIGLIFIFIVSQAHQALLTILALTIVSLAVVAGITQALPKRKITVISLPPPQLPRRENAPISETAAVKPETIAPPEEQHTQPAVETPPEEIPLVLAPEMLLRLPDPVPVFISRETELDRVAAELRHMKGMTALAIIGPNGSGKSTLINRAFEAHMLENTFPDGYSWHIGSELHGDKGLRRLLIEVLDRLGGPAVAMTTTLRMGEQAVADLVRGKQMVFWLDSVPEDFPILRAMAVLTARDAHGVGPALVITSAADWNIPEIHELAIEMLQTDEAMDVFRGWMEYWGRPAVSTDYDAIKAICANVSSLPIALRVVAGYAAQSNMSLAKLAAELGSAVYPPGDIQLAGSKTLAYIVAKLFPRPQRIFALLGVFEDSLFSIETACAVVSSVSGVSVSDARSDIESMIQLGLLQTQTIQETNPNVWMHPITQRFCMEKFTEQGTETMNSAKAALATVHRARRQARDAMTAAE